MNDEKLDAVLLAVSLINQRFDATDKRFDKLETSLGVLNSAWCEHVGFHKAVDGTWHNWKNIVKLAVAAGIAAAAAIANWRIPA